MALDQPLLGTSEAWLGYDQGKSLKRPAPPASHGWTIELKHVIHAEDGLGADEGR